MAPSGLYARLCHAFSSLNLVQFFRFLKGRCHGNQFCVVPDLLARSQSISGSAGPISQSSYCMVGIELQMIDTSSFFRYLKRRCYGNEFSGKNGAKLPTPLHLSLCQSKMEWVIVTLMSALKVLMMPLYRVKIS